MENIIQTVKDAFANNKPLIVKIGGAVAGAVVGALIAGAVEAAMDQAVPWEDDIEPEDLETDEA